MGESRYFPADNAHGHVPVTGRTGDMHHGGHPRHGYDDGAAYAQDFPHAPYPSARHVPPPAQQSAPPPAADYAPMHDPAYGAGRGYAGHHGHYAPEPAFNPQPHYGYDAHGYGPVPGAHPAGASRGSAAMPPPAYMSAGGTPPPLTMRPNAIMHAFGAVLSLALVVAAGVWTWQMMQRDVSGVPVVRALEGPSRVAPEDPGGRQAAFQGLAINELAGASEDDGSGAIMLAPPPTGLGATDMQPRHADQILPPGSDYTDGSDAVAVSLQTDTPEFSGPPLGFVTPNRFAVTRSPRPPARGQGVQVARAAPPAQAVAASVSSSSDADAIAASVASSVAAGLSSTRGGDVDPASIGPGTRLVQLGAYDDAAAARAAWDQLSRRFSPLLDDRGRVIEAAHSGGSVFYRLRAHGFDDERDARRFCSALVAQNIDCIPVLVR